MNLIQVLSDYIMLKSKCIYLHKKGPTFEELLHDIK
jgi:hypothetical protein